MFQQITSKYQAESDSSEFPAQRTLIFIAIKNSNWRDWKRRHLIQLAAETLITGWGRQKYIFEQFLATSFIQVTSVVTLRPVDDENSFCTIEKCFSSQKIHFYFNMRALAQRFL